MMQDLRDAIRAALEDADPIDGNGTAHLWGRLSIDEDLLYNLQQEFNIYFREPNAPQLRVIDKP